MNAKLITRVLRRALRESLREDGMALATVVAFSAILFLLATTLLMVASQQQITTSHYASRTEALQLADAGITAYEQHLKFHGQDTSGTIGPQHDQDGSWTVNAAPDPSNPQQTILTSYGQLTGNTESRKIVTVVRPQSLGDYAIVMNKDYSLGSGGIVDGDIVVNGTLSNDGEITGYAYYGTSYSGSGKWDKGKPTKKTINFADMSLDMTAMLTKSQFYNTYVPPAGNSPTGTACLGYRVVLNGNSLTYDKVIKVDGTTGALSLVGAPVTMTIPDPANDTAIYFDDEIWISGNYSRSCTIASSSTQVDSSEGKGSAPYANSAVFIVDNIVPTQSNSTAVMGIVTPGDISIPSWYTSMQNEFKASGTELDIFCSLLSQNGIFHFDDAGQANLYSLHTMGSRAAQSNGNFSGGFTNRTYEYDDRLRTTLPPAYPKLHDGSLHIVTWNEY